MSLSATEEAKLRQLLLAASGLLGLAEHADDILGAEPVEAVPLPGLPELAAIDDDIGSMVRTASSIDCFATLPELTDYLLDGQTVSTLADAIAVSVLNNEAGFIQPFCGATPPDRYLLCNGQSVLIADYPALFARIGHLFSSGVSAGYFGVPDLRGLVPRGGVAGTIQSDELRSHAHSAAAVISDYLQPFRITAGGALRSYSAGSDGAAATGSAGGGETRMKNMAVNYIICGGAAYYDPMEDAPFLGGSAALDDLFLGGADALDQTFLG